MDSGLGLNYGDRFVRSRRVVERTRERLTEPDPDCRRENDLVYKELYSCSKEAYKKLLASAFSLAYQPDTSWEPLWPVKSRHKPLIQSPDIVLDLPSIRSNFCYNLMDWSSTNFLTVAFPDSVYLWHASTCTTMRYLAPNPTCIKWNPEGTRVLTAVRHGDIKIVNVEYNMERLTSHGRVCHYGCFVTSTAFHPSQRLFLVGCSKGAIEMYSTDKVSERTFSLTPFKTSVTQLAFSCNGRYYAVATVGGRVGVFYGLSHCSLLADTRLKGLTRAISWHPWKESCLVAGDTTGRIYVFDVSCSLNVLHITGQFNPVYKNPIYALSFNPISAELVVSYRLRNGGVEPLHEDDHTSLLVLSSLDRVVDSMTGQWGATNFFSWSPDGTQLATAGSDESARIWSFLPKMKSAKKPAKDVLKGVWSTKKKSSDCLKLELEDTPWCALR